MSLTRNFLFTLSAYCRCRIINGEHDEPYLERYHLIQLPLGYQMYLHRFIASDPGNELHNHPWKHALSIVLNGSYREKRLANSAEHQEIRERQVKAGSVNSINGQIFHRIDIDEKMECWSLFIHSKSRKNWGFLDYKNGQPNYHNHDSVLKKASRPDWWKTADRPVNKPAMRAPLKPAYS